MLFIVGSWWFNNSYVWVYLSGLTTTSIANFCSYIDYPSLFIKNEDFCTELMTFTWPFWFLL
ncbi:hypothetical protein BSPWISOXPB_5057 [uncultured Gammaproteobacteria bacterium]|nr:hypothetical protein BSPWISOXPB_5057 [uncultured Gammaproteobacteria bacterium]